MKSKLVNIVSFITITFILGACSTTPVKRPYLQEYKSKISHAKINVVNAYPIKTTYYYKNSAGLLGGPALAAISVAADSQKFSTPFVIAKKDANALYRALKPTDLDRMTLESIKLKVDDFSEFSVDSEINLVRSEMKNKKGLGNNLFIEFDYYMQPDFSRVMISATAWLKSRETSYKSTNSKKPKDIEQPDTIYLNTFFYDGTPYVTPAKTEDEYLQEREHITKTYDEKIESTKKLKEKKRFRNIKWSTLKNVKKHFTKEEIKQINRDYWIENNAQQLKQEILKGQQVILSFLTSDLSDNSISGFKGKELTNNADENRANFRIKSGVNSGGYRSVVQEHSDPVRNGYALPDIENVEDIEISTSGEAPK